MINPDQYLRIGTITGAHGLHGRLKVYVTTDVGGRFRSGNTVYCENAGSFESLTVEEASEVRGKMAIVKVEGVGDRNAALALRGRGLFIDRETAEKTRSDLDEDEFYYYDLIGCDVRYQGRHFGSVTELMKAGSGEILVITDVRGGTHMVPFVKDMVDVEKLNEGVITIHPVEGLLDL